MPSAAQSSAEEMRPAIKLDAAALSAGVKVVMGKDAAPEASAETAAAAAAAEAKEEPGSALMASTAALDAVEETGLIERQSVEDRKSVV